MRLALAARTLARAAAAAAASTTKRHFALLGGDGLGPTMKRHGVAAVVAPIPADTAQRTDLTRSTVRAPTIATAADAMKSVG